MAAPIQAPGFEDPNEEFLATGMAPLADPGQEFLDGGVAGGAVVEDSHRKLIELGVALGAAFLVMRHQAAKELADADNPRPDQSAALAHDAWRKHLPLWLKLSIPVIKEAMAARAGSVATDALAEEYSLGLGQYLDETSAEGLALGFTRQLEDRQNEKLSWQRSTEAYGLGPREMFTYISGVLRSPPTVAGEPHPARAALDALLLRRADLVGGNEIWRAMQSAKALAYGLAYRAGALPAGTKVEWDTREDEATCAQCGPMDHQRVEPGTPFAGPGGIAVSSSPLHPGCRCEIRLIAPVQIAKSVEEEPRDTYGRWTAAPALALDEVDPDTAVARPYARPQPYARPGGRLVRRTPYERPAAKVEAPPSPSPPSRDEYRRPEGSTGPTREPYTRPAAAAPAPRPDKAKKPKKKKQAVASPARDLAPAPQGKLVPFTGTVPTAAPAAAEPELEPTASPRAAWRTRQAYLSREDLSLVSDGSLIPGATVQLGTINQLGTTDRAPVPVEGRAYVEAQAPPSDRKVAFWHDQFELIEETREDATTDVATVVDRRLGTTDIDAIYRLAGLPLADSRDVRRAAIVRSVERGGGSTLSEAYLDYVTYTKPQAAGDAGKELAERTFDAGVDTDTVPVGEVVVFDDFAPGDSAERGASGEYQVAGISYTSNSGVTPGYAGVRRIHLRPAPISKRLSAFGISHAPASVTGSARDA